MSGAGSSSANGTASSNGKPIIASSEEGEGEGGDGGGWPTTTGGSGMSTTRSSTDALLEAENSSPVRPASIKRVRTEEALAGLEIGTTHHSHALPQPGLVLPPPDDCPPYLQASQLPVWVGRAPAAEVLTPERVDELHHVQWRAWKEGRDGNKDYGRILEAAPALFHAGFARMNPHNCAITVGITVDAMQATGAPPLACATTFLYGLSLLADNPVRVFIGGLGCVCMWVWVGVGKGALASDAWHGSTYQQH